MKKTILICSGLLFSMIISSILFAANDNIRIKETLAGVVFSKNPSSVKITVISTGCTTNANFEIESIRRDSSTVLLTIYRIKKDTCKRMPFYVTLTLNLKNIQNVRQIIVKNDIIFLPDMFME